MKKGFKNVIKYVPSYVWILTLIMLVGIFLRTYNLHNWLNFRDDQARDAYLASQVAEGKEPWPIIGPYMSYSGDGDHVENNAYHIGPIYYYLQDVSFKIFGGRAETAAYPDILFGILSIPLFFIFLKIYFKENVALGVTGLYAISSYFVEYSRFAWNTNLIPFFVLLFLTSLHRILKEKEKTPLRWAISAGLAIGVGVQLHVILMAIMGIVGFAVFLVSIKKSLKIWAVVFLAAFVLNIPQIYYEIRTNFSNTKILFNSASRDTSADVSKLTLLKNDLDCNAEASAFFLSSHGENNCSYDLYEQIFKNEVRTATYVKFYTDFTNKFAAVMAVLLFLIGYSLLVRNFRKDKHDVDKIYFLRLITFFVVVSFLIMLPLSVEKLSDFRYSVSVFFMPFVFFGMLLSFIGEKIKNKYLIFVLIAIVSALVVYSNCRAISNQALPLITQTRSCSSHSTTLGEIEPVADYLIANSKGQKTIYFEGDESFRAVYTSLEYVLRTKNINSIKITNKIDLSQINSSAYVISCKAGPQDGSAYEKVGDITVIKLK